MCVFWFLPEPPVQSHGTDGPPALVQAAAGLLQGVALRLRATGSIFVSQQDIAQTENRRYAHRILLNVPLQLLDRHTDGHEDRHRISLYQRHHVLNISPQTYSTHRGQGFTA